MQWYGSVAIFMTAVLAMVTQIAAAEKPPPPVYPQVNAGGWYEVDPAWPKKPEHITWAAVPGVAVDKDGNVWMYTRQAPSVQVYDPAGNLLFTWGDAKGAHHLKFDRAGHVWTTDIHLHVVQKHERDGTVLMTLGSPGEAGTADSHFYMPTDVAFSSNGDIFVSDGYGNARVVHFKSDGTYVKSWGSLGVQPGEFSIPHAIAIDSQDRIYVADRNNDRVQVYNTEGTLLDSWTDILVPWGFWITADDDIWLCGSSPMTWQQRDPKYPTAPLGCPPKDQVFMRFTPDGKLTRLCTVPKGEDGAEKPGDLNWVHCIALDEEGNIYAGDITGKRLQKFVWHEAEAIREYAE